MKCEWCEEKEIKIKTDEGEFCSEKCANKARMAVIEENSWMWQALR